MGVFGGKGDVRYVRAQHNMRICHFTAALATSPMLASCLRPDYASDLADMMKRPHSGPPTTFSSLLPSTSPLAGLILREHPVDLADMMGRLMVAAYHFLHTHSPSSHLPHTLHAPSCILPRLHLQA